MQTTFFISVSQQKGGSGKSTVAAHLAVALNQRGYKVAIIDIDPQGSLAYWFSIRQAKFGEHYTGVHLSQAVGWRISSEINRLKGEYDFIIIDSPPHIDTEAKNAIRAADLVIIPVQPSPTDVWATKATIELADYAGTPYSILLNRVPPNSKLAKELVGEFENVLENSLGNRVAFISCVMEGKTVTETEPNSQAAKEVKAFVEEVLGKVKAINPKFAKETNLVEA